MKCPTCFAFLQDTRTFVCTGSCDATVNPQATAVRGHEVRSKPTFTVTVPPSTPDPQTGQAPPVIASGTCPTCSSVSTQEICGYCLGEVPPNWRAAKVTCIAMAGARATGKSLMLAAAKEQLELLVERHYRSAFRGLGDTEAFFERNYTSTLFEQRRLLEATVSASAPGGESVVRVPLIFHFKEKRADGASRTRILVLRDVAGEDLEALGGMDNHLSFFSRADAVIALIDPLTVRQVRDMLADLVAGDTKIGGDGIAVLQHVLGLMTNHAPGVRTQIPLAVVLSKFDTLQRLRDVQDNKWSPIMNRPGSPIQRDPSLETAAYDQVDGDLLHAEVQGLLELLNASVLTAMLEESADQYRYFAASALGESPEGDMIHAGGIASYRVVDPFKWAMQVTG
jgi:hypothetical protein